MAPADEELVARALATRDATAFGELVRRHQSMVRGWLRQLTRDPVVADDLAQDTFIRAWQKLGTFTGKGRFVSWLLKVAHNVFLQRLRKTGRDQNLLDRVAAEQHAAEAGWDRHGAALEDELPDLPRFLSVLSADERRVMVLGYAYGMSHGEIHEITGLPMGTIKSHISRGKTKIRDHFELEETDNG